MSDDNKQPTHTPKEKLGILLKPKNLIRTIASAVPGSGPLLELHSQLEGAAVGKRLTSLEGVDLTLQAKLQELEKAQPKSQLELHDWPIAVESYLKRIVDFVVFYDAGIHSPAERGHEFFHAVAHGCIVGPNIVLTCNEALSLASEVAAAKRGRVVIVAGYARYDFEAEEPNDASGLVICRLTQRDEEQMAEAKRTFEEIGFSNLIEEPLQTPIKASVTPWIGQEIGFLHTGEAIDSLRLAGLTKLQFDTSVISHFRMVSSYTLKSFVTAVLPGRVLKSGSPVFTRTGTLVGVMSDTESYPSDAGRRAIVKSLLGHPLFTTKIENHELSPSLRS